MGVKTTTHNTLKYEEVCIGKTWKKNNRVVPSYLFNRRSNTRPSLEVHHGLCGCAVRLLLLMPVVFRMFSPALVVNVSIWWRGAHDRVRVNNKQAFNERRLCRESELLLLLLSWRVESFSAVWTVFQTPPSWWFFWLSMTSQAWTSSRSVLPFAPSNDVSTRRVWYFPENLSTTAEPIGADLRKH